jgi:hypothetical protein
VTVTYVPGRTAIMTIYDDGREVEKITMHEIKDRPALHALMVEKGFRKKSEAEIAAQKERDDKKVPGYIKSHRERQRKELEEKQQRQEKVTGDGSTQVRLEERQRRNKEMADEQHAARRDKELANLAYGPTGMLPYRTMMLLYAVVGVSLVLVAFGRRRKRHTRRS